ncbi:glycosyltransferase family A protein [Kineobactrum sediminis]|nr:glycosyltransferase family A protein [Kineobactrum sediminis]
MSEGISVTVIIPTFNRAKYIAECIASLLAQTMKPDRIIVVNDGSTDDTLGVLSQFGDRITVVNKANGGKAQALNFILPSVTSDYVWLFDDDDVALPDSISHRASLLSEALDVNLVISSHFVGVDDVDGKIISTQQYQFPMVSNEDFFFQVLCGCFFTLPGMLIATSLLRDVGPFDEALLRSQDYDIIIRLLHQGKAIMTNTPTFIVRLHSGVRGPLNALHDYQEKDNIWLRYDQMIGRKVRSALNLMEYLPEKMQEAKYPKRLALMRRMSVMASKGLVPEMVEDVASALSHCGSVLSSEEILLCRGAACTKYFVLQASLGDNVLLEGLKPIRYSIAKRQIIRSFCRGLLWSMRSTLVSRQGRLNLMKLTVSLYLLSRPLGIKLL